MNSKSKFTQAGYTLVEVALSIAILGIGLVTISAATVRLSDSTWNEIQRNRASMSGAYILECLLHDVVTNQRALPRGLESGKLNDKLKSLGYFEAVNGKNPDQTLFQNWTYELNVLPMQLPVTESEFDQIRLDIFWDSYLRSGITLETIKKKRTNTNTTNPQIQSNAQ